MGRMGERSHVSGPPPPQRHASASRVPDKDRLIEKLMRDNEELTSTVNELDGRLRAALRERDELEAELAKDESERITGAVGKQLLASIQEQSALARREREEGSRSHEFLEGIFRELEKQLVAAREMLEALRQQGVLGQDFVAAPGGPTRLPGRPLELWPAAHGEEEAQVEVVQRAGVAVRHGHARTRATSRAG